MAWTSFGACPEKIKIVLDGNDDIGDDDDIVHANSVRAGIATSLASIGSGCKVVWHVHDNLPRHPLSTVIRLAALVLLAKGLSRLRARRQSARRRTRLWLGHLDSGSECAQHQSHRDKPDKMVVHLVVKSGCSRGIVAHHAIEIHAGAVREDQPRPNDDCSTLAIGNTIVVSTDQARALRNQQILARRCVVHILAHDSLDLTRQVGIHFTFKRRRNVPSRLDFVLR